MKKIDFTSFFQQGIMDLSLLQQKDGSFLSFSSPDPTYFSHALTFQSTFSTSLILSSLCILNETPKLKTLKKHAAHFLLTQKSPYWSFNYWARSSQEAQRLPYPDDLDDTFCALSALFLYQPQIITGEVLAHAVTLLTTLEKKEGGPYRTWLVDEKTDTIWRDVDIAVNSNIAYFLSLQKIELTNLNRYIEKNITLRKLISPYYPSSLPILYFISRFYVGKEKTIIIKQLLSTRNSKGYWDNPLDTALGICVLLHYNTPPEELTHAVGYIIEQQRENNLKAFPFYTGVNPKKDKTYFAGSSALTTAFCLEAIAKYQKALVKNENQALSKQTDEKKIYQAIVDRVEKRFASFDKPLKKIIFAFIHKLLHDDTAKQISLLPYYFTQTLGRRQKEISSELVIQLGAVNVFGWIAYTIYDDFLDEEGDPHLLSFATIALREVINIFENILPQTDFVAFSQQIMDQLDRANAWEVSNTRSKSKLPRYGNYHQLADKSLGHALGPLAILFALGYNKNSPEIKNLLLFFTHYLIAKQLNDDAHDWEHDLQKGQINAVGAMLLKKQREGKNKTHKKLQKIFWYEVLPDVSRLILKHTKKAHTLLKKCPVVIDQQPLVKLLETCEQSAHTALEEQAKTLQFLKHYEK